MQSKRIRYDPYKDYRLEYIEQIIQSKIKYVQNTKEVTNLLQFPDIIPVEGSRVVFCKTDCSKLELINFIAQFGDYESIQYKEVYEITFKRIQDADLCAIASNSRFLFKKEMIFTSFSVLRDLSIRRNIPVYGLINENMPVDYYKLIIGPLDVSSEIFLLLKDSLNEISHLFAMKQCIGSSYYSLLFKDQSSVKRIVEILSSIKIKNNDKFTFRFAYEDCIITDLPDVFNMPFVSSIENTRIVFLLNSNITKSFIISEFPDTTLEFKVSNNKMFIKCLDLKISTRVYEKLGGSVYQNSVIISGFYPEFNYEIGDL